MAERSPLKRTDLMTVVPTGVTLAGLSEPRFDGASYYRTPVTTQSTLDFSAQEAQFVQMEYQLFSPFENVTGTLKLDGRVLDQATFPVSQFIPNVQAGAFVPAGSHRFTLEYRCQGQPCAAPINQYWTRLGRVPSGNIAARQDAGLGVERWWLNAPDSPLKITGTGLVFFDGFNFARGLPEPSFQLSWPSGQALNASMILYSSQPFRVTFRVGKQVLDVQTGDKNHPVSPAVSLVGYQDARSLTVQVECLKQPGQAVTGARPGCASLYLPQIAVLTVPPASALQVGGTAVTALLLVAGLWRWLRLSAGRRLA